MHKFLFQYVSPVLSWGGGGHSSLVLLSKQEVSGQEVSGQEVSGQEVSGQSPAQIYDN